MQGVFAVAIMFWVVIGIIVVANGYFVYQVRVARYRVMQTLAEKTGGIIDIILGGHDHVVEVGVDVIPVDQAAPELPHIAPSGPAR